MTAFDALFVVGLGGTGSALIEPLIRLSLHHPQGTNLIVLFDGDNYEESNSTRQLFDRRYLGVNKAVAAAARYAPLCPSIIAYPQYLTAAALTNNLLESNCQNPLVILAVDRDKVRHNLIKALDEYGGDFACLLPGNEFRTASLVLHQKINGVLRFPHPFDCVSNYAMPEDTEPGACGEQTPDRPQLICANFASAGMVLDAVYSLFEDEPLPFRVNYNGATKTVAPEGRLI